MLSIAIFSPHERAVHVLIHNFKADFRMNRQQRDQYLFVIPPREISLFSSNLACLSSVNRIHSLSCIKSAEHGWLGASWSCCELLTFLHHSAFASSEVSRIVLSKGHAAAMQYASLYALGLLSRMWRLSFFSLIAGEKLLAYKDGAQGLEAHADLLLDTGSLGQCLSAVAGLALAEKVSLLLCFISLIGRVEQEVRRYSRRW